MATVVLLTSGQRGTGTSTFRNINLPQGLQYIKFGIDMTNVLDSSTLITVSYVVRYDGGLSEHGLVTFQGGPIRTVDLGGNPIVRTPPFISTHEVFIPRQEEVRRQFDCDIRIQTPVTTLTSVIVETR